MQFETFLVLNNNSDIASLIFLKNKIWSFYSHLMQLRGISINARYDSGDFNGITFLKNGIYYTKISFGKKKVIFINNCLILSVIIV